MKVYRYNHTNLYNNVPTKDDIKRNAKDKDKDEEYNKNEGIHPGIIPAFFIVAIFIIYILKYFNLVS